MKRAKHTAKSKKTRAKKIEPAIKPAKRQAVPRLNSPEGMREGSVPSKPAEPELRPPTEARRRPVERRRLPKAGNACPVVGFGASAGGLEAFTAVLEKIPPNSGMAFVLVQHLDPEHVSLLNQLLSRATVMPVIQVNGEMKVEPNHVYVIAPNKGLIISRGVLYTEPRAPGAQHMPIDRFFQSLANDQGGRAIGVVLSGTASDGAQGVRAIKAAGGITFVQDPATASFDSMPRNAIATECVDSVLPPAAIAEELVRLRLHPYLREQPEPEQPSEQQLGTRERDERALREILNLVRNATGVDFNLYKPGTVRRRILRRMALLKMENLDQYVKYIRQNPPEASSLFQDILIHVTSFFREPATFDAIKTRLLPSIFKDRPLGRPVRIWVPGCATGEDVYSIAICLFEYMREAGTETQLQIFGTDLSEAALERARAGIYSETIEADVSPRRLKRFFVRVNNSYQVARPIRDACIFAIQDIAKDPPFSKIDLILCRNVLIYLGPALQANAIRLFHYALQPNGYLVLGLSESAGSATDLFESIDKKLKIYVKRSGLSHHSEVHLGISNELQHPVAAREPARPAHLVTASHKVDQLLLARYSPPAVVVDRSLRVLEFRGHTAPYIEHPVGEATLDLRKIAPGGLGLEMQRLLRRAESKGAAVKGSASVVTRNMVRQVALTVVPIQTDQGIPQQFLVVIEEPSQTQPAHKPETKKEKASGQGAWARRVTELEQELAATRKYLQTMIEEGEAANEELKSAHEEVQSANEELQSTNEELLTAKEELQSANEELTTLNEEMQGRNIELQQVNNDLLNLLSSVNIPILMLGSDLRIRRFTPQAEKLLNLLSTDVGRPVSDLRLRLNTDVAAICHEVLDDLTPREREVQDNEGRTYSMWVRPYRTAENRIEGVVSALFDITERKQSAEARYRRLFEAAADGILIADAATGVILDINPFLLKLSGYTRAQLLGTKFWESPLFEASGLDETVLQQLHETESFQRSIFINSGNGQRIETELVCNLYAEGEKKVVQFNIRDISARKRTDAQLRAQQEQMHQAQRLEAVGRLAGGVAHDFNNLLTALLGHCDLLEKELGNDQAARPHLEQIRAAAARASLLTKQLLAFGRKQVVQPAVLDLNEIINDMQQLMLVMLHEGIRLELELQDSPVQVKADRSQMEQVLLNLVLNARDALPKGGQITIATGWFTIQQPSWGGDPPIPQGEYATLTVRDSGTGMDPETQARIFEPFFTTKPRGEGVGLGLSTIYSIVHQSGGYITASSTLGAGTTFTIYLPKAAEEKAEAGPLQKEVAGGTETILLVDDEAQIRDMAAQYLSRLGYRVLQAQNGPEALRLAKEHEGQIDILVTDVVMPNMSGREVAFQLAPLRPEMKVLYISGHNQDVIAQYSVMGNPMHFLQKPFRMAELAARVRSVLDEGKTEEAGHSLTSTSS